MDFVPKFSVIFFSQWVFAYNSDRIGQSWQIEVSFQSSILPEYVPSAQTRIICVCPYWTELTRSVAWGIKCHWFNFCRFRGKCYPAELHDIPPTWYGLCNLRSTNWKIKKENWSTHVAAWRNQLLPAEILENSLAQGTWGTPSGITWVMGNCDMQMKGMKKTKGRTSIQDLENSLESIMPSGWTLSTWKKRLIHGHQTSEDQWKLTLYHLT